MPIAKNNDVMPLINSNIKFNNKLDNSINKYSFHQLILRGNKRFIRHNWLCIWSVYSTIWICALILHRHLVVIILKWFRVTLIVLIIIIDYIIKWIICLDLIIRVVKTIVNLRFLCDVRRFLWDVRTNILWITCFTINYFGIILHEIIS